MFICKKHNYFLYYPKSKTKLTGYEKVLLFPFFSLFISLLGFSQNKICVDLFIIDFGDCEALLGFAMFDG